MIGSVRSLLVASDEASAHVNMFILSGILAMKVRGKGVLLMLWLFIEVLQSCQKLNNKELRNILTGNKKTKSNHLLQLTPASLQWKHWLQILTKPL